MDAHRCLTSRKLARESSCYITARTTKNWAMTLSFMCDESPQSNYKSAKADMKKPNQLREYLLNAIPDLSPDQDCH